MLSVIFHPSYLDYSFGPRHPFWAQRAQVFLEKLSQANFKAEYRVLTPPKASDRGLRLVHAEEYLAGLGHHAQTGGAVSPDTPVTPKNLKAAYYSAGGSILTVKEAFKGQKAVNLLGGLHHAGISSGSGFCLFNDHAVAIRVVQKEGLIKKAMIFDLDVHAGQGTQEIFYEDPSVFTVSLHQDPATLYPGVGFTDERGRGAGESYNLNVPLPPGTGEKEYLVALDRVLPLAEKFNPDLVILVLGVDTYKDDPLANFRLEKTTYRKIGERFCRFDRLAVMFVGGYSRETPDLWLEFLKGLVC